jgi:leucyl-tRNA synthetase
MIIRDGEKMAKSRGNTLSPRVFVEKYGADATRTGILSLGPPEADADIDPPTKSGVKQKDSAEKVVQAAHRFLGRLYRLSEEVDPAAPAPSGNGELRLKTHEVIERASHDLGERRAFNTAISAVIELTNDCYRHKDELAKTPQGRAELKEAVTAAAQLIFPIAPHTGAECYQRVAGGRVWQDGWPQADQSLLASRQKEMPVMIDNKLRAKVTISASATEAEQEQAARSNAKVQAALIGREVVKVIVVPGRMVNFVTKPRA